MSDLNLTPDSPPEPGVTTGWIVLWEGTPGPASIMKVSLLVDQHGGSIVADSEWQPCVIVDDTAMTTEVDTRRTFAALTIPAAIHRLDALTDPVSRAVLDLHRREPWGDTEQAHTWMCRECMAEDYTDWPCTTVETVAAVHAIDLADAWLFTRPADRSLDQCQACTWVEKRSFAGYTYRDWTPCEEHT